MLGVPVVAGGGAKAKVYGVSWDKGSTPTLTRTDDAVGMVANAGVGMTPVTNDFDAAEIYKDITTVTDSLGNVFVRIPRFYIRKTDGVGYKTWQISRQPFTGAYLPWCFWDFTNSRTLDYTYVGKYNATLGAGDKLESKSGKAPLVSKNIVQFRGYAEANGGTYQQLDIHAMDVIQTLFYVEFATLNSQAIMQGFTSGRRNAADVATATESGANRIIVANATAALYEVGQTISVGTSVDGAQIFYGRTLTSITDVDASNKALNFDGTPVNIAVGNIVQNTGSISGFSSGIAASSGSPVSNSTGKYPCVYRGIENPWGSIWQFVDGLNINDLQAWVCKNAASYASNLFASPYEQLSYVDHNASGYFSATGFDPDRSFAALPVSTADGDAAKYYCDYYYQAVGQRIARVGGDWSDASGAGVSYWNLNRDSGATGVNIGGRLMCKALM